MGASNNKAAVYRDAVESWLQCGCWSCRGMIPDFTDDEERIRTVKRRFADSVYYWSGTAWQDYLFHICNSHPFLGMFFCHPLNPYSKTERMILELMRTAGSCAWTVLFRKDLRTQRWIGRQGWYTDYRNQYGPQYYDQPHQHEHNAIKTAVNVYFQVTLWITLGHNVLTFFAKQSGRPDGFMERWCGRECTWKIQWLFTLMVAWVVLGLAWKCNHMITVPCVANNWGQDIPELEHMWYYAKLSVLQGYILWFVYDWTLPVGLCSCPWRFGFWCKWKHDRDEAMAGRPWQDWFSDASSAWSSRGSSSSSDDESSNEKQCLKICP